MRKKRQIFIICQVKNPVISTGSFANAQDCPENEKIHAHFIFRTTFIFPNR